jgi:acylphosphatase
MSQSLCHVVIRGVVQGVGYRAWVEQQAMARHLEGWVRNRRDHSVEALFAGPADAVADMIAQCRRGPSMARVDVVDVVEEKPGDASALDMRFRGERFSVLPTL